MHRSPPCLKQAPLPTPGICTMPTRLCHRQHSNEGLKPHWGPSVAAGQEVQP